jgi:hypothetical protein
MLDVNLEGTSQIFNCAGLCCQLWLIVILVRARKGRSFLHFLTKSKIVFSCRQGSWQLNSWAFGFGLKLIIFQ